MLCKKQALFAQNVAKLIQYCAAIGKPCTLGEAFRTPEQAEIYAQEGKGIKNSKHTIRMAIDLNVFNEQYEYQVSKEFYQPLGDFWKSLHVQNRWGGDWTKLVDSNHFEMLGD